MPVPTAGRDRGEGEGTPFTSFFDRLIEAFDAGRERAVNFNCIKSLGVRWGKRALAYHRVNH